MPWWPPSPVARSTGLTSTSPAPAKPGAPEDGPSGWPWRATWAPPWGGAGLYLLASASGTRLIRPVIVTLVLLGLAETAFWLSANLNTWLVMATLLGLLGLQLWPRAQAWSQTALKFIGLYVMVAAVRSPLYLVLGHPTTSDAITLQHLTWIPAIVWALAWMGVALMVWVRLYQREVLSPP